MKIDFTKKENIPNLLTLGRIVLIFGIAWLDMLLQQLFLR